MSKPKVIIRTLEDSPDWLDQQLVKAYLATEYWVDWPTENGLCLRIGEDGGRLREILQSQQIGSFFIITAYNPNSHLLTELENEERDRRLRTDLEAVPGLKNQARNIDPMGKWPDEAGYCVCGADAAEVLRLGRKYGQNALLHWQSGAMVALWWL